MKKTFLSFVGGVALCFSMLFSSCGNGDNALEEIINGNSTVSALADAVKDGAEVTLDMGLLADEEYPMKVYFKKEGNSFTFLKKAKVNNTDYDWSDKTEDQLNDYLDELQLNDDNIKATLQLLMMANIDFTHDTATNQLKFLLKVGLNLNTRRRDPIICPLLAINFDVNKNTFSQYSYPFEGSVYFKGISVDGVDKSSQIKSSYDKKASVYFADDEALFLCLYIFYNEGETWTNLKKRYLEEGGYALLKTFEELDEDDRDDYSESNVDESDLFITFGRKQIPFLYNEAPPTFVSESHKAGYKANGTTANSDGYLVGEGGNEED